MEDKDKKEWPGFNDERPITETVTFTIPRESDGDVIHKGALNDYQKVTVEIETREEW